MLILDRVVISSRSVAGGEGDPRAVIADEVLWSESLSSTLYLPMMGRAQGFWSPFGESILL